MLSLFEGKSTSFIKRMILFICLEINQISLYSSYSLYGQNKTTRRRYWPAVQNCQAFLLFSDILHTKWSKTFLKTDTKQLERNYPAVTLFSGLNSLTSTLCMLMICCSRSVSVSLWSQSLGEGGWLHIQGEPLETEASGLHPRPAGAHRLLQPEAWGGTDKKHPVIQVIYIYKNNAQIEGILCHISTISRLQLLQHGPPSCTVTLQPSTPSWVSGESGIVWWSGCLGRSGPPIRSDLICHSGTRCAWPGHTLKTDPPYTSMVNQWTSWQVGLTTGLQGSELWRVIQGFFS